MGKRRSSHKYGEEGLLHRSERLLRELSDQLRTTLDKQEERPFSTLTSPLEDRVGLTSAVAAWSPLTSEYDDVPLPLLVLW